MVYVAEVNPHDEISINHANDLDDEIDFQDLYLQYVNAMEEENREKSRRKQLEDVFTNVKKESILHHNHTIESILHHNHTIESILHHNHAIESILHHNHTIEIESQNERI